MPFSYIVEEIVYSSADVCIVNVAPPFDSLLSLPDKEACVPLKDAMPLVGDRGAFSANRLAWSALGSFVIAICERSPCGSTIGQR